MSKKSLLGIIIVIIGVNIFWNSIFSHSGSLLAPIIFFVLGLFFYKRDRKVVATIFYILSASIFFDQLFSINLISLLIAVAFLYYGLKMVREKKEDKEERKSKQLEKSIVKQEEQTKDYKAHVAANNVIEEDKKSEVMAQNETVSSKKEQATNRFDQRFYSTPTIRKSLIGDIHYTKEQFELRDMTIWNGFGDVRLDLSKAIIPEGESVVIIQGLIGQIDVYVPDDLAITVQASAIIGDVSLFHEKHGGVNQQLYVSTQSYKQAPRRVKFILSTVIGEVKVRAV
ncbi:cell wall-active antibiotics response protein LiaF [Bacillus solitudinis]|uniref:cell wall-active antibiotics response protein LiaF n=1 Tax=Bacillus solitudinis TaxID=2014074 RepID=UPI000C239956|nr:cell wall-active antibiotics response protein LiaF [Bacillus solitudinis]